MEPIEIRIVDDHTVVRYGLIAMLSRQQDFAVAGQAINGLEAVEKAHEVRPDVILMDLRPPEMGGVEAMLNINSDNPYPKSWHEGRQRSCKLRLSWPQT